MSQFEEYVLKHGGAVYKSIPFADEEHCILLVTHQMDLSGAPLALLYFAWALKDLGYRPMFIAAEDGDLHEELAKAEIPLMILPELLSASCSAEIAASFDNVVCNTLLSAPIVSALSGTDVHVIWWIHEADILYSNQDVTDLFPYHAYENVHIYAVGPLAIEHATKARSDYPIKSFLYYLPKLEHGGAENEPLPFQIDCDKTIFGIVGVLEPRKGQDLIARIIEKFPEKILDESCFVFIGRSADENIAQQIQSLQESYPDSVKHSEFLNRQQMINLYEQLDCLICPSRDDPMPIVVTEAQQFGIPVICSTGTGSSRLIEHEVSGLLFENENEDMLASCISRIIDMDKLERGRLGLKGKEIYEKNFTYENFKDSVKETLSSSDNVYPLSESELRDRLIQANLTGIRNANKAINFRHISQNQQARIAYLEHVQSVLQNQIEEERKQTEAAWAAYEEINNAFFWKITKPVRAVLQAAKRLVGIDNCQK